MSMGVKETSVERIELGKSRVHNGAVGQLGA
jgi:hypothetical protein